VAKQRSLFDSYRGLEPMRAGSGSGPDYVLNGRAGDVDFSQVTVTGRTADVRAGATVWLTYAHVGDDGTTVLTRSNVIDVTARLIERPGSGWTVDHYTWTFAAGHEP
jgi:hypothetical protein